MITILCSFAPPVESNGILFDSCTITFWIAAFLSFLRLPFLIWGFTEERFSDETPENQSEKRAAEDINTWKWLTFFTIMIFFYTLATGTYSLTFYPILVNFWHFTQSEISYFLIAVIFLGVFPPTLYGVLNAKLGIQDRVFSLASLLGVLAPFILFAYPTHQLWNLLVGSGAAMVFGTLMVPTTLALFSKKVGTKNSSGLKVGIILAFQALGTAFGSIIGNLALRDYQKFDFLLWMIPLGISLCMVIIAFPLLRWEGSALTTAIAERISRRSLHQDAGVPTADLNFSLGQQIFPDEIKPLISDDYEMFNPSV